MYHPTLFWDVFCLGNLAVYSDSSKMFYQCLAWNNCGWIIVQNAICPLTEFNLTLNLCHTRIKAAYKPTSFHPLLTARNLPSSSTLPSAPVLMTAKLLFKTAWSIKDWIYKWEIIGVGLDFTHQDLIEFWKVVYDIIANFPPPVWPRQRHHQRSHFWGGESYLSIKLYENKHFMNANTLFPSFFFSSQYSVKKANKSMCLCKEWLDWACSDVWTAKSRLP